jgi:hypothetical protein
MSWAKPFWFRRSLHTEMYGPFIVTGKVPSAAPDSPVGKYSTAGIARLRTLVCLMLYQISPV